MLSSDLMRRSSTLTQWSFALFTKPKIILQSSTN